jgi:hypothetical protein
MDNPKSQAGRISLEDFTDTVLASVGRAMDVQAKAGTLRPIGPILIGIIWWPEGGPTGGPVVAQQGGKVAK